MTAVEQLEQRVGTAKHFKQFLRYHRRHPEVFDLFCVFTDQLLAVKRRHCGAHLVVQRLRWETSINPERYQGFKISNTHFPFYARLFMLQFPLNAGFFHTKPLHDADGNLIIEETS